MALTARPDADINNDGSWTDREDTGAALYAQINETSSVDTEYIFVIDEEAGMEELPCTVGLGDVTDPDGASGTYKVVFRGKVDAEMGGGGQTLQIKLLKGGAVKATSSAESLAETFGDFTHNLTSSEKTACGDFSDLSVTIIAQDNSGAGDAMVCSSVYFECPDAAAAATTHPFLLFVD